MLPYAMQMLMIFCVTGRLMRDENRKPRCDPIARRFCCEYPPYILASNDFSAPRALLANDIRDNRD